MLRLTCNIASSNFCFGVVDFLNRHTHTHTQLGRIVEMKCVFLTSWLSISGGRPNKRRQHGHRIHNKGGVASSLEDQGKHSHSSPELQAIDPNVRTPPPPSHRRGPRRHPNGKGFIWKQVGFSECSKTCGGGNHHFHLERLNVYIYSFKIYIYMTGVQQALIVCVRERDQAPVSDHRCKEEDRPPSETVRCSPKPCPAE